MPIHLHTHDTSGIAGATVLAAVDAGVDAVDAAMDAMSGTTSQPCLGSLVEALRHTPRDPGLDPEAIRQISFYWEAVRTQYAAFESDLKAGASEVYLHEMPGGQFTNLKEQARSLGLETRWHDVAKAYRAANDLFGDIVKVTPSSKVVGDMALMMVAQRLFQRGCAGSRNTRWRFPPRWSRCCAAIWASPWADGRKQLQAKVLKDVKPITERPGALHCRPPTWTPAKKDAETKIGRPLEGDELLSYLMYPKVFTDYAAMQNRYGPVSVLPTPVYLLWHEAGRGDRHRTGARQDRWWCGCRPSARPTRKAKCASSSSSMASPASSRCPTARPSRRWKSGARRKRATTPMSPRPCPAPSPPSR